LTIDGDIMNNYIIPIALVAVIMVAGIFAFVPVQQASSVHAGLETELEDLRETFCDAWFGDDDAFYNAETDECLVDD